MGQSFPVQSPPISLVVVGLKSTVKSGNSTLNGLCCYKKVCGPLGLLHNNAGSGAYHRLSPWTGGCVQHKLLAKHGLFLLWPARRQQVLLPRCNPIRLLQYYCAHSILLGGAALYSASSSLALQLRSHRQQRHVTFSVYYSLRTYK